MKNNIFDFAAAAALRQTGFESSHINSISSREEDGHIHVELRTDWQKMLCILDSRTLELLGIDSEPSVDHESIYSRYGFDDGNDAA